MLLRPIHKQSLPPESTVRRVARHDLRRQLMDRITSGKLKPGTKLVQGRLAKEFKVSLGLIRETLLDLQAEGLVQTDDNRGVFVREFDTRTLIELCDVREAIEGMAARLACRHIKPGEAAELRQLINRMCKAHEAEHFESSAQMDRRFHDRINEICGNEMIRLVSAKCRLFGKIVYLDVDVAFMRNSHTEILEAVAAKDPDRAEAAARAHVRFAKRLVEECILKGGQGLYWLAQ
jgi:DNA-binding GntR family transcriptional regulator